MSNRILVPPFLSEPPIYDKPLDNDNTFNDSWINWLNSITRVTGYSITHDYLIDPLTKARTDVPLLMFTSLTEAKRDTLENARNGVGIYNETTSRMNFREGGAWVTFTPVAA